MKIGLACDHAGFEYKEKLKNYLKNNNIKITDYGCYSLESVDYPDFAHQLSKSIEEQENELGIQMIPFQFMVYVPKYKGYRILE